MEGVATSTSWEFVDASGNRVVFTGTFEVVGGVVQDGIATGFEVFHGTTKVMTGSGYSLSDDAILRAAAAAQADDYTIFYPTFFKEVREIGSADTDHMYGSTKSGKFFGMGGNDFLYGGLGKEVMKGGTGDDWLEGRGKQDKLFGNAGADTFAFTSVEGLNASGAVHRIKDFSPGEDKIFLDAGRFTAIDPGPLDKSEFGIGGRAETRKEHILYKKSTGALFYDEDGKGGISKVQFAELKPDLKLKASHFEADFIS
jgi:Ca2+-binding RTX toxin-like protein